LIKQRTENGRKKKKEIEKTVIKKKKAVEKRSEQGTDIMQETRI